MPHKKSLPKGLTSHFPKSKKEEAEFGKGKKDIIICPKCDSVYFYKSWHHNINRVAGRDARLSRVARSPVLGWRSKLSEDKNLKFVVCPACRMIAARFFEGEVIIENTPNSFKKNIINTIKNVGKIAFERDTQDRIISIREISGDKFVKIRVLTTENQLAIRIAKKIKSAFKSKMKIQYSKSESTARVKINFEI